MAEAAVRKKVAQMMALCAQRAASVHGRGLVIGHVDEIVGEGGTEVPGFVVTLTRPDLSEHGRFTD